MIVKACLALKDHINKLENCSMATVSYLYKFNAFFVDTSVCMFMGKKYKVLKILSTNSFGEII